ncbi:MAG: sialidase family protein [Egibacteraceae bacterium]
MRAVVGLGVALLLASPVVLGLGVVQASTQDGGGSEAQQPAATAAVQVTSNADPARAHASPQIARNPETGELVVAETDFRTEWTCNVHISGDEGRTWTRGGDPMLEPWTDCAGDPDANVNSWVHFDSDGVLHLVFAANDPAEREHAREDRQRHVFHARSEDSGRTFETTTVWEAPEAGELPGGGNRNVRTWVAVDPNDPDRVYVSWMNWWEVDGETQNRAMLAASDDSGATFGEPVSLGEEGTSWYEARPVVDSEGAVHVVYHSRHYTDADGEWLVRSAYHEMSTDHGATWSDPQLVDEGGKGTGFARKWGLSIDSDTDTLYVVWYGHRDPEAEAPDEHPSILLRVSTDSGETWSEPRTVNDELDGVPNYHPGMAVAPNGRLDIAWLDFRNSVDPTDRGGLQDVFYSYSTDGGETFSADARVTDRQIDRRFGIWSNSVDVHAPVGITATDDATYFVWQDTRNGRELGQAEDVYFAALYHDGDGAATSDAAGLPSWAWGGSGLAIGMGLAMLIAVGLLRRRQPQSAL